MPGREQATERVSPAYTKRAATDTVSGREPHPQCPCIVLMVLYVDPTTLGGEVWHMLCPSCAAGWVREVA